MIRLQTSRNKDNSNNMFNHSFLFLFEERLYTKGAHPKVNRHSIAKVRPLQLSLQTFGTWNTSKHSLLTRRSDMNLEQLWEPQNAFGDMGVSENRGTPKSSHFNEVFHFKPSILGFSPYFRFNIHMWSTSEFVEKNGHFGFWGAVMHPNKIPENYPKVLRSAWSRWLANVTALKSNWRFLRNLGPLVNLFTWKYQAVFCL